MTTAQTSSEYEYVPHKPVRVRWLAYPICNDCGLVYLKNDFTAWAVRMGCDNKYHRDFERKRKQFTKLPI